MAGNQPVISIKSLTDFHLDSFIRSPYHYFFQSTIDIQWRHDVQLMINQVVEHYYQLPRQIQNSISIMKLIDRYRADLCSEVFESKIHYCIVLAKITDHLLQFLSGECKQMPQVFLYDRGKTLLDQWESPVSVSIELTECSNKNFVVEKYLLETDQPMLEYFQIMLAVYSLKAFDKLPEKLKLISLLDGKEYVYTPTRDDVKLGNKYLKILYKKQPLINRKNNHRG